MKRTLPDLTKFPPFGRLTVLRELPERNANGMIMFECRCECGRIVPVQGHLLIRGVTKSCGCLFKEYRRKYHTPEDYALINKYRCMRKRCYNPNNTHYKDYGGRGITISDEFSTSEKFIAWSKSVGFKLGDEIDRIDNNGPYSPDNCRFTDRRTQQNNRRSTHFVSAHGTTVSLAEWERKLGERPGFLADLARNYGDERMQRYIREHTQELLTGVPLDHEPDLEIKRRRHRTRLK